MGLEALNSIGNAIKNPLSQKVGKGGLRGSDFPHGLQITEWINGQPNLDTQISLAGNLMPFQPFEWEGHQRLVKNYYPGNPEPSVQVMGAKEENVQLKGRLKDKRYQNTDWYGVSYQYTLALDEMRKRGNIVSFGMYGDAGQWVRFGYIERGKFSMKKLSYIDYEIELMVMSETLPVNNYFASQEKDSPDKVNQDLINAASDFQAAYSAVPATVPQSLAGAINNLIGMVAKDVNIVTGFVQNVLATAKSIQDSANRAIGLIRNAQATISIFKREVDALKHGFNTLSSNSTPSKQARESYANVQYVMEAMAGTRKMEKYLSKAEAQWQALSLTVPKARYKVQTSDTLQSISVKFYGNANNAMAIYEHNLLQSTVLSPGKILEIPKV